MDIIANFIAIINTWTLADLPSDVEIMTELPESYEKIYGNIIKNFTRDNQGHQFYSPWQQEDIEPEYGGSTSSCLWETKVIKPYSITYFYGRNENKSINIVQSVDFEQKLKVTLCKTQGIPCYEEFGLDQFGIKTGCVQKYEKFKLLVFTKSKRIVESSLNLPACCLCSVIDD